MKKPIVIPREVKIHVSRKDIDTGKFGDPSSCAIAKAIKNKLGDHPDVDDEGIKITLPCGTIAIYDIPNRAVLFIGKFDAIEHLNERVYNADGFYVRDMTAKEYKAAQTKARKALKPFTFVARLRSAEWS